MSQLHVPSPQLKFTVGTAVFITHQLSKPCIPKWEINTTLYCLVVQYRESSSATPGSQVIMITDTVSNPNVILVVVALSKNCSSCGELQTHHFSILCTDCCEGLLPLIGDQEVSTVCSWKVNLDFLLFNHWLVSCHTMELNLQQILSSLCW